MKTPLLWVWLATGLFGLLLTLQSVTADMQTLEGLVVSAGGGKLVMNDTNGQPHSYQIGDSVMITINGKLSKLEELKPGTRVKVTTDKEGQVLTVATVDRIK